MSAPAPTEADAPAKRRRVDERERCGVVRVEAAKTGRGHCGWCDTLIAQGAPRVVKRQYHGPGDYVRNNGASTGRNSGGVQDLFLHPQCAWTHLTSSRRATCACCGAGLAPGTWHFATRLGRGSDRCVESGSGKTRQCADCVAALVGRHRRLLDGHLGARSQFDEPVAWVAGRTLLGERSLRPEPAARAEKARLRAVFATTAEAEAGAVDRHRALQATIETALADDAARGGKLTPNDRDRPARPTNRAPRARPPPAPRAADDAWTCGGCTYRHVEREAGFLACAMCATPRP